MFTLRRWWDRHGLQTLLVVLALGSAWTIRQTQGSVLLETYRLVMRPFQVGPFPEERLLNARVLELQERLIELESQNQKLRELIGYATANQKSAIVAPVIGRSADHWWQQVTVGRGSRDGVQVGAIVTGTGGLVGRVTGVTPTTSRVLLISDPTSQVGVTISRSRHTGFMRGKTENQATMEFFDKLPDVRPGDAVVTSSFSKLFPAGIPVGRVVTVNLNKSPAPEAMIELTAPINYLEWVLISPDRPAPVEEPPPLTEPSTTLPSVPPNPSGESQP